jgi:hypothetical protein
MIASFVPKFAMNQLAVDINHRTNTAEQRIVDLAVSCRLVFLLPIQIPRTKKGAPPNSALLLPNRTANIKDETKTTSKVRGPQGKPTLFPNFAYKTKATQSHSSTDNDHKGGLGPKSLNPGITD